MKIGPYTYREYLKIVESFHGYEAPGAIIGGFMVELARQNVPEGILFDAICETPKCLPDAIQLLTPCTIGNGWLKVVNLGRFALSLYDKYNGSGVRIFIDSSKLDNWSEIRTWLLKLKPKAEQDKQLLLDQIEQAGSNLYGIKSIQVQTPYLARKSRGVIAQCPACGEAYPTKDGAICRGCQGETPYDVHQLVSENEVNELPPLQAVPLQQAVGKIALHDMTQIIPGLSKGPAIKQGQKISAGDLCRLQQMGRNQIYIRGEELPPSWWVHEDEAALAFAEAMAGEGVGWTGTATRGQDQLHSRARWVVHGRRKETGTVQFSSRRNVRNPPELFGDGTR